MTNPRAKCSALNGWDSCNIPFALHKGLGHEFQARWQHKEHIEYSDNYVYCGWNKIDIDEVISSHGNAVRASIRRNRVCRSCLKTYLYLESRDKFLTMRIVERQVKAISA